MTGEKQQSEENLFVPLEPVVFISGSTLFVDEALTPCPLSGALATKISKKIHFPKTNGKAALNGQPFHRTQADPYSFLQIQQRELVLPSKNAHLNIKLFKILGEKTLPNQTQ